MARQLQRRGQPNPFRRRRRLIPVARGPVGVAVEVQGERAHKTRPVLDLAVLKKVLLQLMKHRLQLFTEGGQPVFQQRPEGQRQIFVTGKLLGKVGKVEVLSSATSFRVRSW